MPGTVADAILGSDTIRQITNSDHRTGNVTRQAMISGGATVSQVSGITAEEVTTLTSADIDGLVDLNSGAFVSSGLYVSSSTITVPYKLRDTGGLFQGALSHPALSGSDALIIPTGFEASQDEEAGASGTFEVHWISSDGDTAEAQGSTGNTLASQSFNAEFSLGQVKVNASEVTGIQGVRINPGITLVKSRSKGGIYPTEISIQEVKPSIEITTNNLDLVTLCGGWTSMTSANIWLRKRADSSTYESDGTAEHVKFTFAAGVETADSVSVSDSGNGTITITLTGKALTATSTATIS